MTPWNHVTGAIERGEAQAIEGKPRVNITEELEQLIDATSLLDVLTGLSLVCSEKADHICHNWNDAATARPWRTASNRIERVARQTDI